MNLNKLKGKLLEKQKTYAQCSEAIGITITAFSQKMNGHSNFYLHEVNRLSEYLELTQEEKISIFLS